jgi:hypothetical protein
MAEPDYVVIYAATYPDAAAAQAVLERIADLHKRVAREYHAAVIDKEPDGTANVVKRMDHPHLGLFAERFGGGLLTRKELDDAAGELPAGQAGLVVVGDATIEPALDEALADTPKVFKREIEATADQITSGLLEAFKA